MRRVFLLLWLLPAGCLEITKEKEEKKPVPGQLQITCLQEAVPDSAEPDTVIRETRTRDSVCFVTQTIGNCCGWFASLELGELADTIRITSTDRRSTETVSCDCICLFEIKMTLEKNFFDTTSGTILFWGNRKLK